MELATLRLQNMVGVLSKCESWMCDLDLRGRPAVPPLTVPSSPASNLAANHPMSMG